MPKRSIKKLIICLLLLSTLAHAANSAEQSTFSPTTAKYASWVFMGMVENEMGDVYNYFFRMQRHDKNFSAMVALFDYQSRNVLINEKSTANIANPDDFKWMVGKAFLRYNEISNSWVFGLKNSDKAGFNFKVSMLNKPEDTPVTKYLHNGVTFVVAQAGQLNGHINVKDSKKDQFVTAKNTWFRQIWLKNDPKNLQSLNSLLCRFNDGVGLYSIRLLDARQMQDSIAGLFDSEGLPVSISQFVNIEQSNASAWQINVSTPKMSLLLDDAYQQDNVVAGFVTNTGAHGFCLLCSDQIGVGAGVAVANE